MRNVDEREAATAIAGAPVLLHISLHRIVVTLLTVIAFLLAAHLAVAYSAYRLDHDHLMGMARAFDLLHDANVPTWYSSAVLLACAILGAAIGASQPKTKSSFRRHWMGLALVLLYMSLDETAMIHETVQAELRDGLDPTHWFYSAAAIVLPGVLVLLVAFAFCGFVRALPARSLWLFVVAGAVYLAGALVADFIGELHKNRYREANMASALLTGFEETLEMVGALVLLYALLDFMRRYVGPVAIAVSRPHQRS